MNGESGGNMREQFISGKVMIHYSDVKVTSVMVRVLDGRLSLLFSSMRGQQQLSCPVLRPPSGPNAHPQDNMHLT